MEQNEPRYRFEHDLTLDTYVDFFPYFYYHTNEGRKLLRRRLILAIIITLCFLYVFISETVFLWREIVNHADFRTMWSLFVEIRGVSFFTWMFVIIACCVIGWLSLTKWFIRREIIRQCKKDVKKTGRPFPRHRIFCLYEDKLQLSGQVSEHTFPYSDLSDVRIANGCIYIFFTSNPSVTLPESALGETSAEEVVEFLKSKVPEGARKP